MEDITIFMTIDIVCFDWCIIKVMLVINLNENNV